MLLFLICKTLLKFGLQDIFVLQEVVLFKKYINLILNISKKAFNPISSVSI